MNNLFRLTYDNRSEYCCRFLQTNYLFQFELSRIIKFAKASRKKIKKYSVSKIVMTFHCLNKLFYWSPKILQSLGLQPRISKVFLTVGQNNFGNKIPFQYRWNCVNVGTITHKKCYWKLNLKLCWLWAYGVCMTFHWKVWVC